MEKNQTINCIFEILILNSGAWKYNNFTKFSVMFMQWNFLINFSSSRTEAHTQGFKHLINTIRLNFINGGAKRWESSTTNDLSLLGSKKSSFRKEKFEYLATVSQLLCIQPQTKISISLYFYGGYQMEQEQTLCSKSCQILFFFIVLNEATNFKQQFQLGTSARQRK